MNATALALFGLLLGSPVGGALAVRYIRPRATQAEEIAELRADRTEDRAEFEELRTSHRRLTDYVHELRQHIAEGKPPPPPPWPEGISQ